MILGFLKQLLGGLLGNDASAAPAPQTNKTRRARRGYDEDEKVTTKGGSSSSASSIEPIVDTTELTAEELGKLHRIVDEYHRTLDAAELGRRENMMAEDLFLMAKEAWQDEDYATSMPMFCELALMGYEEAYAYVGIAIEFGEAGMEYDSQLMFKCYQRGIEHKIYPALFRMENYYFDHEKYDEARALYELAIKEGWNKSYEPLMLGKMYEEGLGVDTNLDLAIKYYRMAYNYKEPDLEAKNALERLGATYDAEEFDLQLPQAVRFQPAGELYELGYEETQGFKPNIPLAVAYFVAAAQKGHAMAACRAAQIYGSDRYPIYDEAKAAVFAEQAENGLLQQVKQEPMFAKDAGSAFWWGDGCKKNKEKAIKCLEIGIENGCEHSMRLLGDIYKKEGRMKDAFPLYLQAAQKGQGMAMFEVAQCYENGTGTSKNIAEAIKWYQACAAAPYAAAWDAQQKLNELT